MCETAVLAYLQMGSWFRCGDRVLRDISTIDSIDYVHAVSL